MVIEDDTDVREMVVMALESAGYEVEGARHGREAISLLLVPNGYGVLLLDMRMPVMDGWQFAAALHRDPALNHYHSIPIIVLTAAADAARWAQEIGAAGYLAKPFSMHDVLGIVTGFLGAADG